MVKGLRGLGRQEEGGGGGGGGLGGQEEEEEGEGEEGEGPGGAKPVPRRPPASRGRDGLPPRAECSTPRGLGSLFL